MSSARLIQYRLFSLLLQAFLAVVLLTLVLVLTVTGAYLVLSKTGQVFFDSPLSSSLETYYLAHGNWEGVEAIFTSIGDADIRQVPPSWEDTLLLDAAGRVISDHGRVDTSLVGSIYTVQAFDLRYSLQVDGQLVGMLVVPKSWVFRPWHVVVRLLGPVALLSIFPGILILLVGVLLVRRMVYPLADVIAAAQNVAGGDLSTRVVVRGPQDLHFLTDGFNRMASALERSDIERRNMLADVAHELRTPLSVIRGRLEGILDGIYPTDDAYIAQALESAYLLERLVDDLRLLTLAEARQLPFDLQPIDLAELSALVVDLFAPRAAEKEIALALDVEPTPSVTADSQRVEQVIGNLVNNAIHYSSQNGAVAIRVAVKGKCVECAIVDSGPGVPDEDLLHLFDRFWRAEKSRSRAAGGTGLGLAIARQLIEAQGGYVFARNQEDGGLIIGFGLPISLTQ